MHKSAFIVVGLGFGDEGKGLATDYLCRHSPDPLVIRFNGGHQAGHTVVTESGHQHIFSTFGAGTLQGVPTYWSRYCTFSPAVLLPEYKSLPIRPRLLVDQQCPVTTHYDILYNRLLESTRGDSRHGSCGLGFGATIERHQYQALRLYPTDLLEVAKFKHKLQLIRSYYKAKIAQDTHFSFRQFDHDTADLEFEREAKEVRELVEQQIIQLVYEEDIFSLGTPWQTFIFEGAQGVLLDMDFGIAPHVTRSNTTSKNALQLLHEYLPTTAASATILYVTRSYQTRHGAGPIIGKEVSLSLINREHESNQFNEHQGEFRVSCLDLDALNFALTSDNQFSKGLSKQLLITCLDQLNAEKVPYHHNGTVETVHYTALPTLLNVKFDRHLFSFDSCASYL
ncbi:adenylosuccinate synthetase [Hymenobacter sp. HSC-4F20]|uniref:adenylosuccinate synthetase n=1 Tax=Hymenobacter sp. HSC-4F20 TaxID=2864135 RepID=UPI001C72BD71|nr:adenylosuccinate synthetase [Hymenobacter sp. HSC-4F20]MBX0293125.1 adenylosuccinate synthetase [Hymenobacter sp. HSC-4F20]